MTKKVKSSSVSKEVTTCMKPMRRLPRWVDTTYRGLFKDELHPYVHYDSTSWLSSWKPKDSPSGLSFIKENKDEWVAKSTFFLAAKNGPYPKQRYV